MKNILVAIVSLGLFGVASQAQTGWNWDSQSYYAGQTAPSNQDYYDQGSQVPVYNVDPSICFEPGWDFGGYFSAMFPNDSVRSSGIGGGILLSYFFDRNIGLEFNYATHGQSEAQHVVHANAVYRLPINSCFCGAWAPYVFGGGGFLANGEFDSLFDIGAGLEVRFQSWGSVALFTDYSYNFVEKNLDFSQLRAGFKLPF
ncbi:MAG: hypothetical protein P1U89_08800 [Verrucomicrobiales bacterium]|nr:hypothetical protein [Verrucomicrobiales bacterium]